jgi:hypothetical protein
MSDERIMDRIQKLIDKANGTDHEAERQTYLGKAADLMAVHRIEEAALRARQATGTAAQTRNVVMDIRMDWVAMDDEFLPIHQQMVAVLARLTGVRIVFVGWSKIHVIGYRDDVDFFRMLWLSAHLTFSAQMFPEWRPSRSDGDNIRTLAEAGYKWQTIWEMARDAGHPMTRRERGTGELVPVPPPLPVKPGDGGYMKRQMAASYKRDGIEKPKLTHSVTNYRNSYANGFRDVFVDRVWDMIFARQDAERQASGGAQIVLAKDANAVQAYFDALYPPGATGSVMPARLEGNHSGAKQAGGQAARSVDMTGGRGGVGSAGRMVRGEIG